MGYIKWSGIEQSKYGLTATWYVSAYYGNDNDVDSVGLYNASTNPTGHGGPTRPFATLDKILQEASGDNTVVLDSGFYTTEDTLNISLRIVGDGLVIISDIVYSSGLALRNCKVLSVTYAGFPGTSLIDCIVGYSRLSSRGYSGASGFMRNVIFETWVLTGSGTYLGDIKNNLFIRTSWQFSNSSTENSINNIWIDCGDTILTIDIPRPTGVIFDYSIIIGSVKTNTPINGKTSGVTIEDFKVDGNYFVKSYSEVDLWSNPSGSGASVAQLQEIFCNYFSPIYIDTWQEANLHLRTDVNDIVKYGGLNGNYIGALPTQHWFTALDLWDNYQDVVNTSNLEIDNTTMGLRIVDGEESGTFTSTRISLPNPITADPASFYANLVYNIEGSALQGVSNQRIDTDPDAQPDNTKNQRVVYDFRMKTAATNTDALTAYKKYELDRAPTIDANDNSNVGDNFDPTTETKQIIQDFVIEFTLRKIIIE